MSQDKIPFHNTLGELTNTFDPNRKRKCEGGASNQTKRCCLQTIDQNVQKKPNTFNDENKSLHGEKRDLGDENGPRTLLKAKRVLKKKDKNAVMAAPILELTPISTLSSSSHDLVVSRPKLTPLPAMDWVDSDECWNIMLREEKEYNRDACLFARHPSFQPSMRAMLLDWLNEVCQVYNLHRATYYLALDLFDRYLSFTTNIAKSRLQLLGITSLFVAAKIEEIFPPRLERFAFVCDGACTEENILAQEMVLVQQLNWHLSPMTPHSWLTLFLQIYPHNDNENTRDSPSRPAAELNESFMLPNFDTTLFIQIAHLMDLCTLDAGSLNYSYAVIAASALYHFTNEDIVKQCTGKTITDLSNCIDWMMPFALAIKNNGIDFLHNLAIDLGDNKKVKPVFIQPHTVNLELLKEAHDLAEMVVS